MKMFQIFVGNRLKSGEVRQDVVQQVVDAFIKAAPQGDEKVQKTMTVIATLSASLHACKHEVAMKLEE